MPILFHPCLDFIKAARHFFPCVIYLPFDVWLTSFSRRDHVGSGTDSTLQKPESRHASQERSGETFHDGKQLPSPPTLSYKAPVLASTGHSMSDLVPYALFCYTCKQSYKKRNDFCILAECQLPVVNSELLL